MARFFDGERATAHDVTLQLTEDTLLIRATHRNALAAWPVS